MSANDGFFNASTIHIEFAPLTFDGPDFRTHPHVGGRPGRIAWRRGLTVRAILRAKRAKRTDESGLGFTLRYFVPTGRRAIPAIGSFLQVGSGQGRDSRCWFSPDLDGLSSHE